MAVGFVESNVARGNRNLLVIGLILTVIGGALTALFRHWFPMLIALPGVIALGTWLIRIINPSAHPVYKRLARYGDPQQLATQVNREFAGSKPGDTAQFGDHWLAQRYVYGLSLVPWNDIAWLHIYTNIRNGVRSDYVRVWSRDGKQFVAPAGTRQEEAEALIQELIARAPWAEAGFSPELQLQWNKHRGEFLKRVDARMNRSGVFNGELQKKHA
jgi:hypothetical protein